MSRPLHRRTRTAVTATAAAALLLVPAVGANASTRGHDDHGRHHGRDRSVPVQLLSFNDYHGHLEPDPAGDGSVVTNLATPTTPATTVLAGGAAFLATHLAQLRAGHPNTITAAAGDLIGGSTFTSGVFHDEPSVESLDAMGLDVSSVGNHEFDEGVTELLRMQNGGCHPVDGCFQQDAAGRDIRFPGAQYQYLAANVVNAKTGRTVLPPTWVKRFGKVRVGFIGMTLEGTSALVAPSGVAGWNFEDEVTAGNAAARQLQRRGVNAIIVLLHEGGVQPGLFDQCAGISGPIVAIAEQLSPSIDALVTGHTHAAYNCTIPDPAGQPRKVVSALSFGRIITEMNFRVSERTDDVIRSSVTATNHIVTRDVTPDPVLSAIVAKWVAKAAGPGNRVVGSIAQDINRGKAANGTERRDIESSLSNLIADAQRESTGAQVAFMNAGGVRADLTVANSPAGEAPGLVTYREAFNVQPFSNILQTFQMTGAQIDALLEQQWIAGRAGGRDILRLGISDGFTYSWSDSAPFGSKVDPASIKLNGVTLDPAGTYTVAASNFLADGGDSYTAFVNGTPRTGGKVDLDALIDYMAAHANLTAPPAARSTPLP